MSAFDLDQEDLDYLAAKLAEIRRTTQPATNLDTLTRKETEWQ